MSEIEEEVATLYNVIIDSIGNSNPSSAKILSDTLGIPAEIIVKGLYNTPTVLFTNVTEEFSDQVVILLETLGMEGRKQDTELPLPVKGDTVDVAVYIEDISQLPEVVKELAIFLGCSEDEALKHLMKDPAVILGGVSEATALALANRVPAEITIVNPKETLYNLEVSEGDAMLVHQLKRYLDVLEIEYDKDNLREVYNLSYEQSQNIWKKFQTTQMLQLVNQGFQRFEIILNTVDTSNPDYKTKLTEETGMPEDIIDEVIENLPVQLNASVSRKYTSTLLEEYESAGLFCEAKVLKPNDIKLIIEEHGDLKKSREILKQFVYEDDLPNEIGRWEIPYPLGELLYRFIAAQLELADCEVDFDYFNG